MLLSGRLEGEGCGYGGMKELFFIFIELTCRILYHYYNMKKVGLIDDDDE
jgi:hypothetical protein